MQDFATLQEGAHARNQLPLECYPACDFAHDMGQRIREACDEAAAEGHILALNVQLDLSALQQIREGPSRRPDMA
jgi:hypothetical protein